jgi:hypothetical protein
MGTKTLRAKIEAEARRDAAAFCREFCRPVVLGAYDWVTQAWSDIRRDFRLTADQAIDLWPVYWEELCQETARLFSDGSLETE